jgi:cysteine-rich repeat protein
VNSGTRFLLAGLVVGILAGVPAPGAAQLSVQEQACVTTFNQSLRKVLKAQTGVIRRCLSDFAAGRLTGMTPEACVRSDRSGDLSRAAQKAVDKTSQKCGVLAPAFGFTPMDSALVTSVLSQIDLLHDAMGRDLDTALISNPTDASCQALVSGALLKCQDRRLREFLACQKAGLRNGSLTDAAALAARCLGVGGNGQPDPNGRIRRDCETAVGGDLALRCWRTDLAAAFAPCATGDVTAAVECLRSKSACEACQLLNGVDGLARDCDLFDDGDGANGSCGRECGDGILQGDEVCDDGNSFDGDGCSATCTIEGGWTCSGTPSVCTPKCGDGTLDPGELCDDGNRHDGDGCSSACVVENGYSCSGQPSVCVHKCGNRTIDSADGEACDDGNTANGDGCSNTCQVESGYSCSGQPSVCSFTCGNGTFQTGETCDDGNAANGDGCSGACQIEPGWLCFGSPSICMPTCGDGLLRGTEGCDDGNGLSGDGCSSQCQTETGFQCAGQPSHCTARCGDGFIRGFETCDDLNGASGDGCSGTFCRQEVGYTCMGQPSICLPNCGNGVIDAQEQCDDGNTHSGDGCSSTCQVESGYACAGHPSVCGSTCGNGILNNGEECDDGNHVSRDGCSAGCKHEPGWVCGTPGQACNPFDIVIDSPAHGTFTTAGSVTVSGHYTMLPPGQAAVTINGVAASSVNQVNRTFSHTVSLSQSAIFNPILASVTNTANGDDARDRIVVIAGNSVADGSYSPQSVAMRVNDSGLDTLEPLVSGLAAGQFNLASLIPSGTTLLDECFISVIGCWGSARVQIANPPPSFSNMTLALDSKPGAVGTDIRINNLRIDVEIDGSGLVPSCGLRLTANQMQLTGDYSLEPKAGDPSHIDVNLASPIGVNFAGFHQDFTWGLCTAPIIGDIIRAVMPDVQQAAIDGVRGFLGDPDGGGPQDSPIAGAIQTVLAGVSISQPVGEGLGLMFDAPLFTVAEDNTGITLGADSRFQVSIGSGPGQCVPPGGAPVLTASYAAPASFPSFGPNTPDTNRPYGLGICISSAGFNQLLRGQTECGLMRTSLSTIDLDGPGGFPTLPITPSLLSLIVPEFSQLPPNLPLRVDVAPTIAPIVTGNPGPGGELTDLRIAQVAISIVEPGPETVWLRGALDARLGMDLDFLPDGSGLAITLSPPQPGNISIAITENPLGANEAQVETVLPALLEPLIPQLAGALSSFPLPQFFGMRLQGVEVSRNGQFLSLFANLTPAS